MKSVLLCTAVRKSNFTKLSSDCHGGSDSLVVKTLFISGIFRRLIDLVDLQENDLKGKSSGDILDSFRFIMRDVSKLSCLFLSRIIFFTSRYVLCKFRGGIPDSASSERIGVDLLAPSSKRNAAFWTELSLLRLDFEAEL